MITKEVKAQFLKNVTEWANKYVAQVDNNSAEICAQNISIRNEIMRDIEKAEKNNDSSELKAKKITDNLIANGR